MELPDRVTVVEVGPRDGFQMERAFIPTEVKVEVIDRIAEAGVPKIEATSFVSPRVIPQMADADRVMASITRSPRVTYSALVPNAKGLERAAAAGVDSVRLVVCATETYNQKNVGLSIDQSMEVCRRMLDAAGDGGPRVEAVIGVAFGCPFEGGVAEERVLDMARRFSDMEIRELSVADSVGVANPAQIGRLLGRLQETLPGVALSLHLHDTRGLGLANVLAALEVGIDTFDSSIGGLGGCPITTVSSGNIATEDLVHMCHEMGIETGVDLGVLREASRTVERLLGRTLPSHVLAAGTREELFAKATGR